MLFKKIKSLFNKKNKGRIDCKRDNKSIILAPDMGIANRIFFMMSSLRIFDIRDFVLYWPTKGWVTAPFKDLFDFEWDYTIEESEEILIDRNIPQKKPLSLTNGWRLYIDKKDGLPKNFQKLYENSKHGYSIDLEYNRIPQHILDIYLPWFKKLKASEKVLKRINELDLNADKLVALQVRNNSDWSTAGRKVSLEDFFAEIDKYPEDYKFYLSAMNIETSSIFKEKYGDRIIELPDKNYHSMIDATADLFIMALCDDFVVSYLSTFPWLAWWLGQCKATVTLVGKE